MKKSIYFIAILLFAIAFNSCSSKSDNPISSIEELSKEISKSGDGWDEEKWDEATTKLEEALKNLPEPLETGESISLESSLSTISVIAQMHERKAAKMIQLLDSFENKHSEEVEEEITNNSYDLSGVIGTFPVTMNIEIDDNQVSGSYYYNKRGPNAKLLLTGKYENGELVINETTQEGTPSGHFKGEMSNGVYKGIFINNKAEKFKFLLTEAGVSAEDVSTDFDEDSYFDDEGVVGIDDYDDDSSSDVNGDVSIDKLLNDYEKLMNEYITCIKKMKNNDPTALANYAKMMARYQEFAEQTDKVKGNMSMNQLQRLNRINLRIAEQMEY